MLVATSGGAVRSREEKATNGMKRREVLPTWKRRAGGKHGEE